MSDTDFAGLTEGLCIRFWGKPTLKTAKELRWGSGGSRKFTYDGMVWYDHEAGLGGGALELVERECATDREGALAWMQKEGLIEAHHARSAAPQRQKAPTTAEGAPEQESQPQAPAEDVQEVEVAHWDYANRDGEFQYRVIRYHYRRPDGSLVLDPKTGKAKKTFKQKSRDASGKITFGLNGREPCLYRWQAIEQAIEAGKPIFITEGEKAADALIELGFEATCNSGGAGKNFTETMVATFKGAHVVVLPDNDPQATKKVKEKDEYGNVTESEGLRFHDDGRPVYPGQDHAEEVATKIRRIAALVKVLPLPGIPLKGDVVEWIDAGGTAEQLLALVASCPVFTPRPPRSKFGAIGLDELHQPHLKHEFLIDGFLDRRGVAMMPGASASGKTFLVLEMGMCVALGRDFWGMPVKPGLVIYQAGEGKEGLTKRLDGWMLDRGVDPSPSIPFKVLPRKINLFVDDKDADDLIEEARLWSEHMDQPVRMVVIDTFNKAITGANENAGQDMGRVLARMERISEALDCVVLVPMHKSKQGDMRGHTSLMGDASNVLNVTKLEIRDGNSRQIRTISLDKNKDGEGGHPMRFVLRQVVLGEDENGKPRTTCVVDKPNGDEEALTAEGKLSLNQTLFLQTLRDVIDIEGVEPPPGVTGVPHGKRVVPYKAFEARLWNKWPFTAPEHEPEKRKKEFSAAVGTAGKRLVAHGYVERDNETKTIWWTGKSDRPARKPKPVEPAGTGVAPAVMKELADTDVPF